MLTDADLLNARILIVDDQSAHVHLLERLLHDTGYRNVTSTIDPQQVCALHREHPYDLILLDLQMPVLDGFGVMRALQADSGDSVLPVIALTAQPGHKLPALQAGARDFINKPFDMVEVKIRIRHMLEVRLLYKMLEAHNQALERTVQERTAALQESEDRYRRLTELATDWYWEQNEAGEFTRASGPVLEMLGHRESESGAEAGIDAGAIWDGVRREALLEKIAERRPFLDFVIERLRADGSRQLFRISGEPMFDRTCRFTGYHGIGAEVLSESLTG
jgi:CheY-like chemotaxis protein